MKKLLIITCIAVTVLCSGCRGASDPKPSGITASPVPTGAESPTGTPGLTETPSPAVTPEPGPIHVGTYGFTKEDVFSYFLEVGLQAEYSEKSDTDFIKKWVTPIVVRTEGTPSEEDLSLIRSLFDRLNKVEGFPGIREQKGNEDANCVIRFLDYDEYAGYAEKAVHDTATYGYALIRFRNGAIEGSEIGIRNDLTRMNKNHVILEEVIQSLGLQNDSYSYPDSLFYQGYNEPQQPSDMDWLLVRFLYHSEIKPGMRAADLLEAAERILAD